MMRIQPSMKGRERETIVHFFPIQPTMTAAGKEVGNQLYLPQGPPGCTL